MHGSSWTNIRSTSALGWQAEQSRRSETPRGVATLPIFAATGATAESVKERTSTLGSSTYTHAAQAVSLTDGMGHQALQSAALHAHSTGSSSGRWGDGQLSAETGRFAGSSISLSPITARPNRGRNTDQAEQQLTPWVSSIVDPRRSTGAQDATQYQEQQGRS
jgi:hypothetical protein